MPYLFYHVSVKVIFIDYMYNTKIFQTLLTVWKRDLVILGYAVHATFVTSSTCLPKLQKTILHFEIYVSLNDFSKCSVIHNFVLISGNLKSWQRGIPPAPINPLYVRRPLTIESENVLFCYTW